MISDKTPDNLCPSCGMEKEYPDKPLCFYCYRRGSIGTLKMIILDLYEKHGKMTDMELYNRLNELPFVTKKMKFNSVQKLLIRYSGKIKREQEDDEETTEYKKWKNKRRFSLLSTSKSRNERVGRPIVYRDLTKRGKKRLKTYFTRWDRGTIVQIRVNKKNRKKGNKKPLNRFKDRERARAIGVKIKMKEYPRFKYILTHREFVDAK